MATMATIAVGSIDDTTLQHPDDISLARSPGAILATLIARSFALAAGVALAILLVVALFSAS
jgi:hypothetical protein